MKYYVHSVRDFQGCTLRIENQLRMDFVKRVAIVVNMIPKGKVASYRQIAGLCGLPCHSRQVGHILGKGICLNNCVPVPAHRVVNSAGVLSGADSFETPDTQQKRLESEGVKFKKYRKLDMKIYRWEPNWDELIFMEELFSDTETDDK